MYARKNKGDQLLQVLCIKTFTSNFYVFLASSFSISALVFLAFELPGSPIAASIVPYI